MTSRYHALGRATAECFCVKGRCCAPTQRPDETESPSPWHVCSGLYSALRGRSGAREASTTTCSGNFTHTKNNRALALPTTKQAATQRALRLQSKYFIVTEAFHIGMSHATIPSVPKRVQLLPSSLSICLYKLHNTIHTSIPLSNTLCNSY